MHQICNWDKYQNRQSSKSIRVIKLSFCQNDPLMGESFWQNNSNVTHVIFELQPIIIFSPVANFGNQSIIQNWVDYVVNSSSYIKTLHYLITNIVLPQYLESSPQGFPNSKFFFNESDVIILFSLV